MVKRRKGLSPDAPDFIPLEDRPRVSVVRCSLMGRIRVNDDTARRMVAQVLETAAERASKLAYRASTFLHYWVAERLAANEDVILNRDTLKQVHALFNAESAARRHRPSESMVQAFVATGAKHVDCTGLTNINDAARTELLTSVKNYDEIALEAHIAMYITAKYDVKRGHGSALATKVFRKSPGHFVTLPATLEGGVDRWNTVVREEHARFNEAKGAPGGILRYRRYMLQIIEERNQGRDPEKQYRAFSLLPQRKVGRGFISIDKKTCKELGVLAKQLFPNSDREWRSGVFNEEVDALFNRQGLKKSGKFRLGPTVKTNGVELHVLFETSNYPRYTEGRRRGQGKPLKAAEQTCPEELDPPSDFSGIALTDRSRMVAIDPGNTNPVTLARPIDPENTQTRFSKASLSKGWYTKQSKRSKMKRRGDRDTPNQINRELSEHPLKTSSVESLLPAVKLRFKHHDKTHTAASKKQRLKLRFEVKQAEERAINNTINWILRGGKHTGEREVDVVVFGDAGRMSGLKGTSVSAPMAKIKRLATRRGRVEGFQVYEVNEAYTSKRSSCCPGADTKNMVTSHKMDETADGRLVRSKVHGSRTTPFLATLGRGGLPDKHDPDTSIFGINPEFKSLGPFRPVQHEKCFECWKCRLTTKGSKDKFSVFKRKHKPPDPEPPDPVDQAIRERIENATARAEERLDKPIKLDIVEVERHLFMGRRYRCNIAGQPLTRQCFADHHSIFFQVGRSRYAAAGMTELTVMCTDCTRMATPQEK
ncbi:Hypothetical protein SCF082_LOCUS21098 [Durusdinium trenchii]|uniref:Uncharacterized protein n=1 Tax=Durusdinium trenchii TaxID=1381693 RepID=A0ABP0L788_9DINO